MKRHQLKAMLVCAIVMMTQCKLEPCKGYRCVNGQPLEDGNDCICLCNLGWDGADCTREDKCITHNMVCRNGGYCTASTGLCTCLTGYEGDSCQILSRDKFLTDGDTSRWSATDTCSTLIYHYQITMTPGTENRTLEIYNLRGLDETIFITANVNRQTFEQKLRISFGTVDIDDLTGTLSADGLSVRVTYLSIEGTVSNCKGMWSRQ